MSFKRKDHKVKQQTQDVQIFDIPVHEVDTSISAMSTQRRRELEPNYTGDNPDFAYKSVTEQRQLYRQLKNDNHSTLNDVAKVRSNTKKYNEFKESLKTEPKDGGQ